MGFFLAFILSLLPTLLYTWLLWWLDRYEKEPFILLVLAFVWGAIPAVILSIIFELLFDIPIVALGSPQLVTELLGASVSAPLIEESAKAGSLLLMVAMLWIFKYGEIDGPLDGLIYGGMAGFGFAMVENFFYLLGAYMEGGVFGTFFLAFLRAGLFGLNHAMYTGFTGVGIALALHSKQLWKKLLFPVLGFALGVGAHALHNAFATVWGYVTGDIPLLLAVIADWGGVLVLLVVAVWALYHERQQIHRYLHNHVQNGHLSKAGQQLLLSPRRRWGARIQALFAGDLQRWRDLGKFYNLVTKAAFATHRLEQGRPHAQTDLTQYEARLAQVQKRLA